jgi:hypothetical protein
MSALLKALKSRWLLVAVVFAAAVPVAVSTANGAPEAKTATHSSALLATVAHPVIDNDFLYKEEWFSQSQFVFRVGGADGPPDNPANVNNLPPNYNGANEFYAWWKSESTASDDAHMGPMGKFLTAKDHFAACCQNGGTGNQTYPYQLDNATVTIPGQTCPGQVVLIAGHNDSTPVNAPGGGASGSATPMSGIRGGNWGNGSPYDADTGITMGMAELQGLMRWYQLNGTYPKRTIKTGLFDAEETGLVGSGEYSSTDTPTTLTEGLPAGAKTINVASTNGILTGQSIVVDQAGNHEVKTVSAAGTGSRTATSLSAAAAAGNANIKVASVTNMVAGERVRVDSGANQEFATIQTVGTSGAAGTGVTLASALTLAHASGAAAQDLGSGITLSTPLASAYALGTTVTRTAIGLIPDGPQGQYVMVANMDQNGMEYPAYHWGTQHYLNNIVGGGVGPWYTNINATPLAANGIYPASSAAWSRIQANMAAAVAFRTATADSVSQAFQILGQKYNFSMPLENPLRLDQVGSTPVDPSTQTVPAYTPEDQQRYSPVLDDALGRTDQVSFINRGIPGYGIVGAYDSSQSQAVGGNENPYPANYASKPGLSAFAGQDTVDDYIQHLNYFASGTTHGPGGVDQPSEGLKRALELPATWTDYLIQRDQYGGAVPKSSGNVSYFETEPAKPTTTNTVTFDGSFSRAPDGSTAGLKYFWDFGDGRTAATTNQKVTHTYASTSPHYYDVKLYTLDAAGHVGYYRQAVPLEFQPTLYPATAPAGEPVPPATDPCGMLTSSEQGAIAGLAKLAFPGLGGGTTEIDGSYTTANGDVGGNVPATLALSLGSPASFGAFSLGVAHDYDANMTASINSSAGDATLSVADPSANAPGHLVNGAFSLASALQANASSPHGSGGAPAPVSDSASTLLTYAGPVSTEPVTLGFRQHIGATDPLRTGSYSKTLTFTLSTTTP